MEPPLFHPPPPVALGIAVGAGDSQSLGPRSGGSFPKGAIDRSILVADTDAGGWTHVDLRQLDSHERRAVGRSARGIDRTARFDAGARTAMHRGAVAGLCGGL